MNFRFFLCAAALLALTAPARAQTAAPLVQGKIHFLFLDAEELPMAGLKLWGRCESRLGSFWNPTKHRSDWSCTTSSDGLCEASIDTLAAPDGTPVQCRGTERSSVQEAGGPAQQISYHAFFAKGAVDNYALVQKRSGWKDGQYLFRAVASAELFDALALRYRAGYYAARLGEHRGPDGAAVWDTRGAHPQENPDEQNLVYLRARAGAAPGKLQVQVVIALTYVDEVMRGYDKARFEGLDGEQSVALTKVSSGNTCGVRDLLSGQCQYREELQLDLPQDLAQALAARYREGVPGNWRLQLGTPRGQLLDFVIAHAEFAALLAAARP
ncbi:hypothetical protein [Comamonas sp. NLF-1-9]|uniref:hypothetical protein n=1 Tax=Comamonas sp. NLF-1-9 TaxID=2853163 RepID=UPI001C48650B|nr:hypothetical protein [Comamonas sp. NLF-1-9]QXL83936.1 hypothetical protein KUD94_11930 [Comamonas sp. NLF-1-9]